VLPEMTINAKSSVIHHGLKNVKGTQLTIEIQWTHSALRNSSR
jgi:hypothetical protein